MKKQSDTFNESTFADSLKKKEQEDDAFEKQIQKVVEAESCFAKNDPAEGVIVVKKISPPKQ